MNKIDEKKVKDIIHTIGLNNNLTDEQVKQIVEAQFRFTYEQIRKLKLSDLTYEEIDKLKTNFYYKYIGKLYTSGETVRKYNNKTNYVKRRKEDDGTKTELDLGGDCVD